MTKELEPWTPFGVRQFNGFEVVIVIAQGCGQTLGLGLVDKNRTVVNY